MGNSLVRVNSGSELDLPHRVTVAFSDGSKDGQSFERAESGELASSASTSQVAFVSVGSTKHLANPQFKNYGREDLINSAQLLGFLHLLALFGFLVSLVYTGLFVGLVSKSDLSLEMEYVKVKENVTLSLHQVVANSVGYIFTYMSTVFLPFVLLWRIYGFTQVKSLLYIKIGAVFLILCLVLSHYANSELYLLTYPYYSYALYVIVLGVFILDAALFGYKMGKIKNSMLLYGATLVMVSVYDAIVTIVLLPFYTNSGSMARSVIRVVVTPGIFLVLTLIVRYLVRNTPSLSKEEQKNDYIFLIAVCPSMLKVYYMRIMYSSVSLEDLVWNTVVACILDLIMKLLHWNRSRIFTLMGMNRSTGPAVFFELPSNDEAYAKCLSWEKAIDITGIWYAASVQLLHQFVIGSSSVSPGQTIAAFAIQYAIELANQLISIKLELAHNIPVFSILKLEKLYHKYFPIFGYICFSLAAITTWRAIYLLSDFYSI